MQTLFRRISLAFALLTLVACNPSKEVKDAYCCGGLGVLISESVLLWGALSFRFREEVGVYRVYEYAGSEVAFNRALSTIIWKNAKTGEIIQSRQCVGL
jgi:hypothetical protein